MEEAQEIVEEVLQRRGEGREMGRGRGMGHDGSRFGSAQSAGESHRSASKRTSATCPSSLAMLLRNEPVTDLNAHFFFGKRNRALWPPLALQGSAKISWQSDTAQEELADLRCRILNVGVFFSVQVVFAEDGIEVWRA